jgi:hypothetical protein
MSRTTPPPGRPPVSLVRLATLVIMLAVALPVLGLIGAACWYGTAPIRQDAAFFAQFTIRPISFYAEQPAKNRAYLACCVAAPVLFALVFFSTRRWIERRSARDLRQVIWTGFALLSFFLLWSAVPLVDCPNPPLPEFPPSYLLMPAVFPDGWLTAPRLVGIVLAAGMVWIIRRRLNPVMFGLVLLWLLLAPLRLYAPDEIDGHTRFTYSLNSVFSALSQSINGHHVLVDFPHIYGGYVEILAPFIRLAPRSLGAPLLGLAIPSALAVLFLLLTVRLLVRKAALLWLFGLGALGVMFLPYAADPSYNYSLARAVFPALGLWLSILYFRRPGRGIYLAVSVVAAFASIWNLDTGLVLWLSWLGTLLVIDLAERRWKSALRQAATQTGVLMTVWLAFFLYLRLAAGAWPDPRQLFHFQHLVLGCGYFCVRMLVPDLWLAVVSLYAIGIAAAFLFHFRGEANGKTHSMLMLSLTGTGLFSYFMGRSVEPNLLLVIYPAVPLLALLTGETLRLARAGKLPAAAPCFLAPYLLGLAWWSFLFVASLPNLMAGSAHVIRDWNHPVETPILQNAAFVARQTHPGEEDVYILSNQSGVYYYASGTLAPRSMPGTIELLQTDDLNGLLAALRARAISRLFVDQAFYGLRMYRPDVYQSIDDAIARNYRPVASYGSGELKISLYLPQ